MIAYVTSIGEKSAELCMWSLERNGFQVLLDDDPTTTLAKKLKVIYHSAEDDFVRVDADVIPNRNLNFHLLEEFNDPEIWWYQFMTFDWYQQNIGYGGVQYIKKEALPYLRENIGKHLSDDRPETAMTRLKDFYEPRRFKSEDIVMGMHNYKNDMKRVAAVKANRGQSSSYDFELARRIEEL